MLKKSAISLGFVATGLVDRFDMSVCSWFRDLVCTFGGVVVGDGGMETRSGMLQDFDVSFNADQNRFGLSLKILLIEPK